jgi:hypothetical protein
MSATAIGRQADFDPEALRAKYREERDKRLRADGNARYQESRERSLTSWTTRSRRRISTAHP